MVVPPVDMPPVDMPPVPAPPEEEEVVVEPPVAPPEPPELEELPPPHAARKAEDKITPIENKRALLDIETRYQGGPGCKAPIDVKEGGDRRGSSGVEWRIFAGLLHRWRIEWAP